MVIISYSFILLFFLKKLLIFLDKPDTLSFDNDDRYFEYTFDTQPAKFGFKLSLTVDKKDIISDEFNVV